MCFFISKTWYIDIGCTVHITKVTVTSRRQVIKRVSDFGDRAPLAAAAAPSWWWRGPRAGVEAPETTGRRAWRPTARTPVLASVLLPMLVVVRVDQRHVKQIKEVDDCPKHGIEAEGPLANLAI